MKSLLVHYKNKYPGGRVQQSETSLEVFDKDGEPVVALRKNGANQLVDVSEEEGLRDRHDLAPIPKDARIFKVIDGKIAEDDKAAERKTKRGKFLCARGAKVLSCAELAKMGFEFDEKQKLMKEPAAAAAEKAPHEAESQN